MNKVVFDAIRGLMAEPAPDRERIGFRVRDVDMRYRRRKMMRGDS